MAMSYSDSVRALGSVIVAEVTPAPAEESVEDSVRAEKKSLPVTPSRP
jgi:hypothetical protein